MRDAKLEILKFWFDDIDPSQWFKSSEEFDSEIKAKFEGDYIFAIQNCYDDWMDDANGCLALIILLDQFPRNMYRGKPEMFTSDSKALAIAKHVQKNEFDKNMKLEEKIFSYLPFEHSENLEDQETSIKLFKAVDDGKSSWYDYAIQHYDVVKEFGRFPHRNIILGRSSTELEEEYLDQPNSGF